MAPFRLVCGGACPRIGRIPMKLAPSLALLAALTLPALASFPEPPPRPNFIVVLMDDWGYNDIGFGAGEGGPTDNPDGDEWVNLWEWTLGLSPLSPDPLTAGMTFRSEQISGGTRMILEFDKPRDRQPAIVFQESDNLTQWDDIVVPAPNITTDPETQENWSFTYDIPDTVPRLFLRAKVTE